ncbi:MAG TPA: Lrp/AsnC family transcriptional regulator [Nitrososphaeria archaeon]|nr:Lrp/AsnC family transcriptional regulator [Nitrososphaeria archaeon]
MVRFSDFELIKLLMKNSRTPYVKLGELLGVSETAIRKRIRKLEEDGVIRRYTIEVDPKKLGFKVNALIGLDTVSERFIAVIEELKAMEEVLGLYSASGDHMILLECWFKDSDELTRFVKRLESIRGVTRVCPAIILEKLK